MICLTGVNLISVVSIWIYGRSFELISYQVITAFDWNGYVLSETYIYRVGPVRVNYSAGCRRSRRAAAVRSKNLARTDGRADGTNINPIVFGGFVGAKLSGGTSSGAYAARAWNVYASIMHQSSTAPRRSRTALKCADEAEACMNFPRNSRAIPAARQRIRTPLRAPPQVRASFANAYIMYNTYAEFGEKIVRADSRRGLYFAKYASGRRQDMNIVRLTPIRERFRGIIEFCSTYGWRRCNSGRNYARSEERRRKTAIARDLVVVGALARRTLRIVVG